jgi:hypothetical protein
VIERLNGTAAQAAGRSLVVLEMLNARRSNGRQVLGL